MGKLAIWAELEAKPGKERTRRLPEVSTTPGGARTRHRTWYAIKMGRGNMGSSIFSMTENGRNAHLNGDIAKALFAKLINLLASAPKSIDKPEVLASKTCPLNRLTLKAALLEVPHCVNETDYPHPVASSCDMGGRFSYCNRLPRH